MAENTLPELKQNLIEYCKLTMGDQIVDLELDPAHYEAAYQRTIGTYRQRANNAYEEAYIFMELIRDENIYTLPQEVTSVRQIFRRTFGDSTGPFASNFDPFAQASINVYLMNFNVAGGLATYDFYSQYVELAGRMYDDEEGDKKNAVQINCDFAHIPGTDMVLGTCGEKCFPTDYLIYVGNGLMLIIRWCCKFSVYCDI